MTCFTTAAGLAGTRMMSAMRWLLVLVVIAAAARSAAGVPARVVVFGTGGVAPRTPFVEALTIQLAGDATVERGPGRATSGQSST